MSIQRSAAKQGSELIAKLTRNKRDNLYCWKYIHIYVLLVVHICIIYMYTNRVNTWKYKVIFSQFFLSKAEKYKASHK